MNKKLYSLAMATVLTASGVMAQDPITLNWSRWDVSKTVELNAIADAYMEKYPHITINSIDLGSADYNSMVLTQLSGGAQNIDIVTVKDTPGYTDLIRSNTVSELTSSIDTTPMQNPTYQGLVEELTIDNKLYAMPVRLDYWLVYYNKDLFDKAGVNYPTNDMTLAQFDELTKQMTSGFGANKVFGALYHTWRSTVQLPAIFDGQNTLISKDYQFLKPYYTRILDLQKAGAVPRYASLKASNTHYSGPWFNSSVAMLPMGSWFISGQIAKVETGESSATNWGLAKYPVPEGVAPGTTAATLTSLAIAKNSKYQEAVLDFINFAASSEGALAVAKAGGFPANQTAETIAIAGSRAGFPQDAQSQQALTLGTAYLEMPVDTATPRVEVVLNRAHDAIMTESEDLDDVLSTLNTDVKQILN